MSKAFLAVSMAIVTAAIVVGCGGGDDTSDSSTAALTKAEFIKEADALCKTGDAGIQTEVEDFAEENEIETPTKAQEEELISDIVAPAIRSQAEEIADLGAPEGDEETIEAMVEAVESGADELESDPAAAVEGENPLAEGSKLAKEYGLKECGNE